MIRFAWIAALLVTACSDELPTLDPPTVITDDARHFAVTDDAVYYTTFAVAENQTALFRYTWADDATVELDRMSADAAAQVIAGPELVAWGAGEWRTLLDGGPPTPYAPPRDIEMLRAVDGRSFYFQSELGITGIPDGSDRDLYRVDLSTDAATNWGALTGHTYISDESDFESSNVLAPGSRRGCIYMDIGHVGRRLLCFDLRMGPGALTLDMEVPAFGLEDDYLYRYKRTVERCSFATLVSPQAADACVPYGALGPVQVVDLVVRDGIVWSSSTNRLHRSDGALVSDAYAVDYTADRLELANDQLVAAVANGDGFRLLSQPLP